MALTHMNIDYYLFIHLKTKKLGTVIFWRSGPYLKGDFTITVACKQLKGIIF